jgi:hypothetical protein
MASSVYRATGVRQHLMLHLRPDITRHNAPADERSMQQQVLRYGSGRARWRVGHAGWSGSRSFGGYGHYDDPDCQTIVSTLIRYAISGALICGPGRAASRPGGEFRDSGSGPVSQLISTQGDPPVAF